MALSKSPINQTCKSRFGYAGVTEFALVQSFVSMANPAQTTTVVLAKALSGRANCL